MTGLPKATILAVNDRAGGRCERCGRPIRGDYSRHHRLPRGMGGTRDPLLSHPSNIVLLCGSGTTGCHGELESHRRAAVVDGWILKRHTNGFPTDPRLCPIWVRHVGWAGAWMVPGPGRWFALPEVIT